MNPTRAERLYWSRLAEEVGCIACRIDGRINNYVSIHHVNGRTKLGCHMQVLPLCGAHHQTGGEGVAIHHNKARFERNYGSQASLMEMCADILKINEK